ncbi:MAG: histidine--tRNA ligase [Candidatus Omnitrophica bacterium]|nr:histidine--tRNA ligase [Candidatus Omnitrophota bacterium]
MKKYSLPRGTSDILPDQMPLWESLESVSRKVFRLFNYKEIRTPFFEETDLFARSMGQTSDVVQKQMLNLAAQKRDDQHVIQLSGLSLRPENTASVVRSYIQNGMDRKENLTKLFYIGPMFRGERPQKGRLRQFHQIGVEAIGPQTSAPFLDAEVVTLCVRLLNDFGVKGFKLKINTLGSQEDKENFSKLLRKELAHKRVELCQDCQLRYDRNVFRILDCKKKECQKIATAVNIDYQYLSDDSRKYYQEVKKSLDQLGILYTESPHLVRGLDYYTHLVFEITCDALGSQNAIGAGGRYNSLVSQLGGPVVDAVGFALGLERIILARDAGEPGKQSGVDLYLIAMDAACQNRVFQMMNDLRAKEISCEMSYRLSSVKSQMRAANKARAKWVAILGDEELKKNMVALKNMDSGQQTQIRQTDIRKYIFDNTA